MTGHGRAARLRAHGPGPERHRGAGDRSRRWSAPRADGIERAREAARMEAMHQAGTVLFAMVSGLFGPFIMVPAPCAVNMLFAVQAPRSERSFLIFFSSRACSAWAARYVDGHLAAGPHDESRFRLADEPSAV